MADVAGRKPRATMPGFEAMKVQQEAFLKAMTGGLSGGWSGGSGPEPEGAKSDADGEEDLESIKRQLSELQDKLSKMFFGDKLGGDLSWREHILRKINGSNVQIKAQVHQLAVPLVDILQWEPGTTIDLGVSDDKEISLICSGIPVMFGYAGKSKGCRLYTYDAADE